MSVRTEHVAVNGKRNVALDFAIITARLSARPLEECARCRAPAVEVLRGWHPHVPDRGLCEAHLREWTRGQLLGSPPLNRAPS